jgi:hypothetical protein
MPGTPIFPSTLYVSQQIADTRDALARSRELLEKSQPDSFAGRPTRETPSEPDPLERADIQKLINSELRPPE